MKLGDRKLPHRQQSVKRRKERIAQIDLRLGYASRNVRISCEVPNGATTLSGKRCADRRLERVQIGTVDLHKPTAAGSDRSFEISDIASAEIIEGHDIMTLRNQRRHQMAGYKTGSARDQMDTQGRTRLSSPPTSSIIALGLFSAHKVCITMWPKIA